MEPNIVKPTAIDDVLPVVTSIEDINEEALNELTDNKESEEE